MGDRISGKPVSVELNRMTPQNGLKNLNKFVLSGSGAGKSFFCNHMLRQFYEEGNHIVVVDIGNSYKGLSQLLGGTYYAYSDQRPMKFNPFWVPADEVMDGEKKESLKVLILTLWKRETETYGRSEYVALSNALQLHDKHSRSNGIFPCFDSFYEYLRDHYSGILVTDAVKTKDFDLDNLLFVLRPFYKGGEYDYLLNADRQLDLLDERFIVFELDNIKDHPIFFPVVTIVIMDVFIGKMRKLPGIRKTILLDEV